MRIAALLIALAALPAAGSEYDTQYDYEGQAADWYGSPSIEFERDYPDYTLTDIFSNGDDYGFGYEARFDRFGYGPPLEITERRRFEYTFCLYTVYGCIAAVDCDDGSFCNGAEQCGSQGCASGTAPSCNDFDACTVDSCNAISDSCSYSPAPPPQPVGLLTLDRPLPGASTATLDWSAVGGAESYSVYRGEQSLLGDLSCFVGDVLPSQLDDDGAVAPSVLFYLVASDACSQESSIGEDSEGVPRVNPAICP